MYRNRGLLAETREGKIMRHRVLKTVVLASLVTLGLPSLTMAASPSYLDHGTIKVAYGDLDIDTMEGAKVLYSRIEKAAEIGCDFRPFNEIGSIRHFNEARSCYKTNVTAAVERINSKALTKVHNSR